MKRMRAAAMLLAVGALGVSACGAPVTSSETGSTQPLAVQRAATAGEPCKDGRSPVASIAPGANSRNLDSLSDSPTYQRIRNDKQLVVGTSGDVLLWGATNTKTGDPEGFDIDVLKEIAAELKVPITFKVITYAQRLTYLADDKVDIVAHTMTINCGRWEGVAKTVSVPGNPAINFSSEYYLAGQRVLVRTDSKATRIQDLKGQKVCVPAGSTNIGNVDGMGLDLVEQDVVGDCLVLMQQGQVVAITGDDTVLAGFADQDPYTKIVGPQFSQEPYGLGIKSGDTAFTQFVNAVLQDMRDDGRLSQIYRDTMGKAVTGPAPAVPGATYGRDPNIGQ